MAQLRDALPPGSHVVISHLTREHRPDEASRLSSDAARKDGISLVFRTRAEIEAFFGDFELLPPGLVHHGVATRPGRGLGRRPHRQPLWFAGVGRKG